MEFFCYAYGRLSKEDLDKKAESDSIKNQRDLIHAYIDRDPELHLVMEGYDDGYTGTSFDRPHVREMLEAVKSGKVNCVVVKDLSRFGREYIESGQYIEKLFPALGVRFIAINDNYDTAHLDSSSSLMLPFKNLMNDSYCRDTSIKIRSHLDVKRRNGEFIGSFAVYGYAKDPENKNALVIDEDAAQVVRDIFNWFLSEGMSKAGIARRLNGYGIPNPAAYKRSRGFRYENPHCKYNDGLWSPTTVSRILQDPLYIGVMRQGRQKVISYKVHKRAAVPESEWFIVENAVPAVIDRECFQAAQTLHRRDTRAAPGKGAVYLFSGLIRCADCKKSMSRHTARGIVYYQCRTHRDKSKAKCA